MKDKLRDDSASIKQFPVQNLLGEGYDEKNYSLFVPAFLRKSSNVNFEIIFDTSILGGFFNITKAITQKKTSDNIILDYTPTENMLQLGSKVLVKQIV